MVAVSQDPVVSIFACMVALIIVSRDECTNGKTWTVKHGALFMETKFPRELEESVIDLKRRQNTQGFITRIFNTSLVLFAQALIN